MDKLFKAVYMFQCQKCHCYMNFTKLIKVSVTLPKYENKIKMIGECPYCGEEGEIDL